MFNYRKAQTFETYKTPYLENVLVKRRRQIFSDDGDDKQEKRELDSLEHDGWLAEFIERIARVIRNIGGKK
jgi:hypothetical protein